MNWINLAFLQEDMGKSEWGFYVTSKKDVMNVINLVSKHNKLRERRRFISIFDDSMQSK